MKKILITIAVFLGYFPLYAQNEYFAERYGSEIMRSIIVITVMLLIMWFILSIITRFMEFRLKNKIIDKGITDDLANSILQPTATDNKNVNIKWFALLMGVGTGLVTVNYTQPLGFHSIAFMSFALAFAYLGYYLFLKFTGDK